MAKSAPHPNAAVLFYDYMINDAQDFLSKKEFVPVSKKIDTPLNKLKLKFVDAAVVLKEQDKWKKLYEDIFVKQSAK